MVVSCLVLLSLEAIALALGATLVAMAPLMLLVSVILITNPRMAVYQFIALLFIQMRLTWSYPVYLLDVSAALLILAATFDFLSSQSLPGKMPKLALGFLALIGAVGVAAVFGVRPILAASPLARLAILTLTMLAVYRLSARLNITNLLKVFFWMAAAHSCIALWGFVTSMGLERSFGFSPATLAALAMTAFPIGLVATLWHRSRRKRSLYLAGTMIVLGGIVATQSRFPLLVCVAMVPVVLFVLKRVTRRWNLSHETAVPVLSRPDGSVWRRGLALAGVLGVIGCGAVLLQPDYFAGLSWRFSQLWSLSPTGTFRLRLVLWDSAWRAFMAHPITGIGPGSFRYVAEILPEVRLDTVAYWVRGLSAHNLMLHYLAETGLLGGTALLAMMVGQFRAGRRLIQPRPGTPLASVDLSLALLAGLFLLTTFLETGWLWGQTGFVFAFILALIARRNVEIDDAQSDGEGNPPLS